MKAVALIMLLIVTAMGITAPVSICADSRGCDKCERIMTLDVCNAGSGGFTLRGELVYIPALLHQPVIVTVLTEAEHPAEAIYAEPSARAIEIPPTA